MVTTSGGQPPNGNLERRVAVIEAVLPTLATKADLAELGTALRAEMRSENDKLRAEMRLENEKLLAAVRADNEKMREQLLDRIAVIHEQMRGEVWKMHNSMFRWMVTTMLTMLIAFSAFFIGLGNLLVSRAAGAEAAQASTARSSLASPRPGPALSP